MIANSPTLKNLAVLKLSDNHITSDGLVALARSPLLSQLTELHLDGNQVWQKSIGTFDSKFGYAPSPIIYKSLVIVAADNQGGGYLAALDQKTGTIAWRTARGNASTYSSPTIARVGGREQLLIGGGDRLASYDPGTGEQLWSTPCLSESTCGTVVTDQDRIYASGGYPDKETVCLDSDGNQLWSNQIKLYEPSPIIVNGNLFAVTDNGIAYLWQGSDGTEIWRSRLGGEFSSSPVLVGGLVYVGDLSGNCFVLKASNEGLETIATNQLGSDMYASPAVSNGQMFLRIGTGDRSARSEQLVCIAAPTEQQADSTDTSADLDPEASN